MRKVMANLEEENGKLRAALAALAKEKEMEEGEMEERASKAAEALSLAVERHMKLKEYTVELASQVNSSGGLALLILDLALFFDVVEWPRGMRCGR
jgi:translation initiation factor 2 alpha subunit (eIF-2alpha)